ncbi:unnamed protein product [Mytilus coruscus]|uniref:Uncharacterized protein n=1 Tax=Mytilus coruscus TaxID=42192 RepID=A0A6J8A9F0_MYTCO|nr:unnamed protein product [Mytilus coruscus]
MASPHRDTLDRSVYHPDRKYDNTNPSDSLNISVYFSTNASNTNKSCYRQEERNKRRISNSAKIQTIKENEVIANNYSAYSDNQDVKKKERILQKSQSSLENSSDFLSTTTSCAQTTSSDIYSPTASPDVNQPSGSPGVNQPIASSDVYHFSTDSERNENNSGSFIPQQFKESTSIIIGIDDNQDVKTKEPIQQNSQSSLENNSNFLSPTASSDLNPTTTSSAPTSSSDFNPQTASPDVNSPPASPGVNPPIASSDVYHFSTDSERNENNSGSFIPQQFKESTSIIIGIDDNQDVKTKEPIQQNSQSSLENNSNFLSPTASSDLIPTTTSSAPTSSSDFNPQTASPDVNPPSASPGVNPTIARSDVYYFSTDSERNENNSGSFIPQQFKESTSIIIGIDDNQDVKTKEPIQQNCQSSLENNSNFLSPTASSDLNPTTTSSAPTSSSDFNPQTASPDVNPPSASPGVNPPVASSDVYHFPTDSARNKNNSGSFVPWQFKESPLIIIGIAACLIGLIIFKKLP